MTDGKVPGQSSLFERVSDFMATAIGRPQAFFGALVVIIIWATLGPPPTSVTLGS